MPPIDSQQDPGGKPLLIFDLDETAVYASSEPLETQLSSAKIEHLQVIERPFLGELLAEVAQAWRVSIWTQGTEDYAEFVADAFFRPRCELEFVWSRVRCTRRYDPERAQQYATKNLKKVFARGYPKERVLMLDNTPRKLEDQYGNLVPILSFSGDPDDVELRLLASYLNDLKCQADFRRVEKRGWRSRY